MKHLKPISFADCFLLFSFNTVLVSGSCHDRDLGHMTVEMVMVVVVAKAEADVVAVVI